MTAIYGAFKTPPRFSILFNLGTFLASDIFNDPKRRVSAAKDHINVLDAGIRGFLDSKPYARIIEKNHVTRYETHKIKLTASIPDELLTLADQIAEGLRAALDKGGFAAALAAGNTRLKGTFFPIADTDASIDTDIVGRGRCRDLPDDILKLFRSFEPHKAGNPLIWELNQLANGSKHRILAPVGFSVGTYSMDSFNFDGLIKMAFPPKWDSANNEMILCVVSHGSKPQYNMRFGMNVEVRPGEGTLSGPAAAVFRAIAAEVERVVLATEAECRRLGYI